MSILTRWLLIPPVNARLIGRYRDYRRHGASAFSATLGCFWMIHGTDFYSTGAPALAAYSRRT